MPDVSGLELLAYIRQSSPACKVILITAVHNRQYLVDALSLGAYDYFQKPFDINQLLGTVTQAVTERTPTLRLAVKAAEAMHGKDQAARIAIESVSALVRTVEAKDPYTKQHSEHVTHYAVNLSRCVKLPVDTIQSIRTASLLHDIGKIGVPDHILTKPGPLTQEEFGLVRQHPLLGAEILRNISVFAGEARLVRHHHENWDGSGYPDGLAGEDIPLGARIINIADSIDAMLMERSYKKSYSVEKMLSELDRCAGAQFDPELARTAVRWCGDHPDRMVLRKYG